MPTAISVAIFPDAEKWITDNVRDFYVDNVSAVYPVTKFNPEGTTLTDSEEGTRKVCTMADYVDALRLLCEQIGTTLFVGGLKSPIQLLDAGNWDAEVVDAFYQLVYRKEVIYG